jgi:hypothetical protein
VQETLIRLAGRPAGRLETRRSDLSEFPYSDFQISLMRQPSSSQ